MSNHRAIEPQTNPSPKRATAWCAPARMHRALLFPLSLSGQPGSLLTARIQRRPSEARVAGALLALPPYPSQAGDGVVCSRAHAPSTSFSSTLSGQPGSLLTARIQRGPSEAARWASTGDHQAARPPLPHHRRPVMMNQQPLVADPFKEVRGEHFGLLGFVGLLIDDILNANHPGHVARYLDHDLG